MDREDINIPAILYKLPESSSQPGTGVGGNPITPADELWIRSGNILLPKNAGDDVNTTGQIVGNSVVAVDPDNALNVSEINKGNIYHQREDDYTLESSFSRSENLLSTGVTIFNKIIGIIKSASSFTLFNSVVKTTENHTSTAKGIEYFIETTKNGDTAAELRFKIKGDGSIQMGSDTDNVNISRVGNITLNGAATVWDDLTGDITRTKTVGTRVTLNDTNNSIDYTNQATTGDYIFLNYQMKHAWKPGSDIFIHIHYEQANNNTPNFLINYSWERSLQTSTNAFTRVKCNNNVGTYVSGQLNQICKTTRGITPPSGYGISDIIKLQLMRDTNNSSGLFAGADPYTGTVSVTAVDIHIELDTLGSNTEYSKT